MQTCLVLFSGLPGAGKTTLSRSLQQQLSQMHYEKNDLDIKPSVCVVDAVLELDEFMHDAVKDDMHANSALFSPEAWRRASRAVRDATFEELSQSFLKSQENVATKRLVFLVDTLHYKSMRTAYWKMCRDLTKERLSQKIGSNVVKEKRRGHEIHDQRFFVGMVEVWVNTPVEICIERNECRRKTAGYIPPDVIRGMDKLVDVDVRACCISSDKNNCWVLLPQHGARHWPIVLLQDEQRCSCLSPEFLAKQLVERLLSDVVLLEFEKQQKAILESEVKRQEKEEQLLRERDMRTSSTAEQLHQMDLRMRAAVSDYIGNLRKTGTLQPGIGKLVSKCREDYYAKARSVVLAQQQQEEMSCCIKGEAILRDLLDEFEQKLFFFVMINL